MPRLWDNTIAAHQRAVREAILDTTWELVTDHGLLSVTMSQIAADTGIGRATLYKYFPDVEAILVAWHERHITGHLEHLAELRDGPEPAAERLEAVLQAYAMICHRRGHHSSELAALLHRGELVQQAHQHLVTVVEDLVNEVAAARELRDDVPANELASYCIHALAAASSLRSESAVRRLVAVTLAGLGVSAPSCAAPQGDRGELPVGRPQHEHRDGAAAHPDRPAARP